MSNPVIQTSFNAGEWAPALNARVDLSKYHAGAALLRNFFVDYRGGATTRPGTKYVLQCFSNSTVRLIPFQASFAVTYILEFGNNYIRFFNNGSPVLQAATTITGASQFNPGTITDNAHGYANGDWIFISNVGGMTQLNGNYYIVANVTTNTYTLTDLFGNPINTLAFGAYTGGGTAQRVLTISSPYIASELAQIKFVQNVNTLILCHPNHPPQVLSLVSATSWTLAAIVFGATINPPTSPTAATSLSSGSVSYAYVVTSVDANGQESSPSTFATLASIQDIRNTAGTNTISWTAVSGASSYNVYKAEPSYAGAVPGGVQFGFIGNSTGTSLIDSNIAQDFSQGPPISENPFSGSGVATVTVTSPGNYSAVPSVTFGAAPGGGTTATGATTTITRAEIIFPGHGGIQFRVGDIITFNFGTVIQVTSISFGGVVTGFNTLVHGTANSGSLPNVLNQVLTNGPGTGFQLEVSWGVNTVNIQNAGSGYITAPSVTFTGSGIGGASAIAVLGAPSAGNPTVPGFFQQRLILAGPVGSPSQMNFSQPGSPYNFNTTFPIQADDAIQETLTNTALNIIKSVTPVSAGLIVFSDKGAWLVNGGSSGSAISALGIVANSQIYSGAADLPPIVATADILYVQSKGSIVRDLAYNFYLNNYVGTDISILSSHLFYGFTLNEWAWAEEPFKTVWAVRNDGQLLSLCFVKDQEMIAWAHHDTQGIFSSVASVTEITAIGSVDAVYHVVQRTINGVKVSYIERFVELNYPQDYISSWQVDAGIGYSGSAATTFTGANHLSGMAVTGVADGTVINFTMPVGGTFVFGPGGTAGLTGIASASVVTVGLSFLPQLQTLALDLGGSETIQSKRKKVAAVTVRCRQALGLAAGRSFATLTPMKDLVLGNVGTMSNSLVSGLQTTDARTIVDPQWDVFGQFCIQQSNPYPASILGVIPEIEVGDAAR